MTDMTLQDALAEVKRAEPVDLPWSSDLFDVATPEINIAIATILNAAASGDMIPATDARLAVAEAYRKAAAAIDLGRTIQALQRQVLALADADALAEVQALRAEVAAMTAERDKLLAEVESYRGKMRDDYQEGEG